jgi:hypothetical protein
MPLFPLKYSNGQGKHISGSPKKLVFFVFWGVVKISFGIDLFGT